MKRLYFFSALSFFVLLSCNDHNQTSNISTTDKDQEAFREASFKDGYKRINRFFYPPILTSDSTWFMSNKSTQNNEINPSLVSDLMDTVYSELELKKNKKDKSGNIHKRFQQYFKGIKVLDGELIEHFDQNGNMYSLTGEYFSNTEFSVKPVIKAADVKKIISSEYDDKEDLSVTEEPRLAIFNSQLIYELRISYIENDLEINLHFLVNANDGSIIHYYNGTINYSEFVFTGNIMNIEGGQSVNVITDQASCGYYYPCHDVCAYYDHYTMAKYIFNNSGWSTGKFEVWDAHYAYVVNRFLFTSDPLSIGSSRPDVMSAAYNISKTQEYVGKEMGRKGWDDNYANSPIIINMLFTEAGSAFFSTYDHSFYFGGAYDGNSAYHVLECVAHEYGHAIQYSDVGITTQKNESGAYCEAFADIFSFLVEYWAQPNGLSQHPNFTHGYSDWMTGEDIHLNPLSFYSIRDYKDPNRTHNPSYYHGTYWADTDGDYTHINSTVVSHAFYLLTLQLGIEAAGKVVLDGTLIHKTLNSGFYDAACAWGCAAVELDGNPYDYYDPEDIWQYTQVRNAWLQVGITIPTYENMFVY